MRAGAHDFLCKPVNENDLRAAVEKVFKLKAARKENTGGGGKIIAVFSNKGGNGTTTIAVNLADALARYQGKKVVVVDLALASGDVTMFFNVNPTYSILDLAKNAEKADYDFLHTLLLKHSSGVYILADPPMIEDAESISAEQVKEILSTLRSMFDVIIVDTSHQFEERTLTALEASDIILLVTLLNLPSLKNTKKCLELFGRIGFRDEQVRLVLSRYLPSDEIPREKIEEIMKCPVFFAVPNDYPTVISSVNRGKLLREIAPDKEVTKSFRQMASLLFRGERKRRSRRPRRSGGSWGGYSVTKGAPSDDRRLACCEKERPSPCRGVRGPPATERRAGRGASCLPGAENHHPPEADRPPGPVHRLRNLPGAALRHHQGGRREPGRLREYPPDPGGTGAAGRRDPARDAGAGAAGAPAPGPRHLRYPRQRPGPGVHREVRAPPQDGSLLQGRRPPDDDHRADRFQGGPPHRRILSAGGCPPAGRVPHQRDHPPARDRRPRGIDPAFRRESPEDGEPRRLQVR